MNIKLLIEHHLEFLSLKVGCTGSSESVHVKIPHCWKSHVAAHILCTSFSRGTKVEKMLTLAPERYTAGFCMVAKVILWCI